MADPADGVLTLVIPEELAGQRLDKALAGTAEAAGETLSRSRIAALIEEGAVTGPGKVSRDASSRIKRSVFKEMGDEIKARPSCWTLDERAACATSNRTTDICTHRGLNDEAYSPIGPYDKWRTCPKRNRASQHCGRPMQKMPALRFKVSVALC